jgi:hypothetical protein
VARKPQKSLFENKKALQNLATEIARLSTINNDKCHVKADSKEAKACTSLCETHHPSLAQSNLGTREGERRRQKNEESQVGVKYGTWQQRGKDSYEEL